jgi:hypothetical protein
VIGPEGRVALLHRLLAEPKEVRDENLGMLRDDSWQFSLATERHLLIELDRRFFRPLDELGARRRDLSEAWWTRQVIPVLNAIATKKELDHD